MQATLPLGSSISSRLVRFLTGISPARQLSFSRAIHPRNSILWTHKLAFITERPDSSAVDGCARRSCALRILKVPARKRQASFSGAIPAICALRKRVKKEDRAHLDLLKTSCVIG